MYISTAGITGIFILFMFLYRPASQTVGRLLIAVLAIIAIVGTVPNRKGVAIAIDWLFKQKVQ